METQRQQRIGALLQQDLAQVLQSAATQGGMKGIIISVTKVRVTTDLSLAKAYISIFPSESAPTIMQALQSNEPQIKHELAQRTRHQLRKMPDLSLFLDDSLDYIDNIEKTLNEKENPIKNRDLLAKRKKR